MSNTMADGIDVQHLAALQMQGVITLAQFVMMTKQIPRDTEDGGPASPPCERQQDNSAEASAEASASAAADHDMMEEEDSDGDDDKEDDEVEVVDAVAAPAAAAPAVETKKVSINNSILNFITKNAPAAAKIASARKPALDKYEAKKRKKPELVKRNEDGRGKSIKKQGTRVNDVKPETLLLRIKQWPKEPLSIKCGQLYCDACKRNVGSGSQHCAAHIATHIHKHNLQNLASAENNRTQIQAALHDYKDVIKETFGEDAKVLGQTAVAEATQIFRAETLQVLLEAGVEVAKVDALRPYLERHSGMSLCGRQHLMASYLPPLKLAEDRRLKDEFKNEFVGVYHDGTTHNGESFAIVYRACKAGFIFRNSCVRVQFLRGSMKAAEISSVLMQTCAVNMEVCACFAPPLHPPPSETLWC